MNEEIQTEIESCLSLDYEISIYKGSDGPIVEVCKRDSGFEKECARVKTLTVDGINDAIRSCREKLKQEKV